MVNASIALDQVWVRWCALMPDTNVFPFRWSQEENYHFGECYEGVVASMEGNMEGGKV